MSPETVAGGTIGENGKLRAIDQFDASQADGDQNLLEEEWNAYYDAVAKCNYTNQFAELLDTNSYDSQKAEAITLRCCCYYDLLRLFENIPYVTTGELVGPATQDKPLDVCKSLVEDLKLAEQSLPAVNDSIEQLSIPAAQAMTAKVFMLMVNFGDTTRYPEAEEYALKVINGSHKLTTKSTPRDISAFERRFALPSDY